jgi:hypothetical protein
MSPRKPVGLRRLRKSEKLYPVDSVDVTGCTFTSGHFIEIMDRPRAALRSQAER